MRWVVVSLVVHALVIAWFARAPEQRTEWHVPTLPVVAHVETETFVELVDSDESGVGGGGTPTQTRAATTRTRSTPMHSADAWEQIDVHVESTRLSGEGDGNSGGGDGGGIGGGHGAGFGLGAGGGVRAPDHVPTPPAPPPVSKARPAKLIWPTRDLEVEDDASLFVATVTVDANGDVVGARMNTMRPGAKADHAANAIWTFRYSPALDDDGQPVRSTFEQSFQIR